MSGIWTAAAIGGSALIGAYSGNKASKDAARASGAASDAQIAETRRATEQARGDLFNLFPAAEANAQKGYQGALDVFGQFMPQQAQTFQQGNVAAQNQILAGMPQAQNALMGGAVDYSQFQPTQLNYDPSMFQQQLPEYQTSKQAMDPTYGMTSQQVQNLTSMQPQQQNPFNALSGFGGRFGRLGAGGTLQWDQQQQPQQQNLTNMQQTPFGGLNRGNT